jgi:hypothetical protein
VHVLFVGGEVEEGMDNKRGERGTCTYDVMNLYASWYPVLIVDESSSFSPPSLLAFRVGAGAGCTDKEEPEEEALFFFDFFFNFLGVVTAQKKEEEKTQSIISYHTSSPSATQRNATLGTRQ